LRWIQRKSSANMRTGGIPKGAHLKVDFEYQVRENI
jgi:hypothetical protein